MYGDMAAVGLLANIHPGQVWAAFGTYVRLTQFGEIFFFFFIFY
jgi:hypothetical protein